MHRHLAVYGTLRPALTQPSLAPLASRLTACGHCVIPGRLHDLIAYPALVPGKGRVMGELYMLGEDGLLSELDRYEGYDPLRPAASLFIRRTVRLLDPAIDAWLYVYNRSLDGAQQIRCGDWVQYRAAGHAGQPSQHDTAGRATAPRRHATPRYDATPRCHAILHP